MSLWLTCCASLCLKPSPWLMEKARRDLGWLPPVCHKRALAGFTLAELLICVAILGVIATFIIPKIMAGQQASNYNAAAHEVAGIIAAVYQKMKTEGLVSANTAPVDLIPYMNYVKLYTSGSWVDGHPGTGAWTCSASSPCMVLHNGGILEFVNNVPSFGSTNPNALIEFRYDPQGNLSGVNDSVQFELLYSGRVTTRANVNGGGAFDPAWLSW